MEKVPISLFLGYSEAMGYILVLLLLYLLGPVLEVAVLRPGEKGPIFLKAQNSWKKTQPHFKIVYIVHSLK